MRIVWWPSDPRLQDWAATAVRFIEEVYGVLPIDAAFIEDVREMPEVLFELGVPTKIIKEMIEMQASAYISSRKLVVVLLEHGKPPYVNTETFFHEVTHYIHHEDSTVHKLASILVDLSPTLKAAAQHLHPQEVAIVSNALLWLAAELAASYFTICYLRKLSRSPCGQALMHEPSIAVSTAYLAVILFQAGVDAYKVLDEMGFGKERIELHPKVLETLHREAERVFRRWPADLYEEYKDTIIFEGREQVLRERG